MTASCSFSQAILRVITVSVLRSFKGETGNVPSAFLGPPTWNMSSKSRHEAGAMLLSPLGPMTFILSTNLSKADTDKTESFNFNLGTTF